MTEWATCWYWTHGLILPQWAHYSLASFNIRFFYSKTLGNSPDDRMGHLLGLNPRPDFTTVCTLHLSHCVNIRFCHSKTFGYSTAQIDLLFAKKIYFKRFLHRFRNNNVQLFRQFGSDIRHFIEMFILAELWKRKPCCFSCEVPVEL